MDSQLLENYAHAVRARRVLKLLPDGLSQHCLQYEQMCLSDIQAQSGNQNMTESEALALTPSITGKIIKALLPIIAEIALALLKRYAPAIAASGTIGAILATYLVK